MVLYKDRLQQVDDWCLLQQRDYGAEVHVLAAEVQHKSRMVGKVVLDELMEACYRECLLVAPDFDLCSTNLIPRGPTTLACALWIHLAQKHGYKRVEDDFYIPVTDDRGRMSYRAVPLLSLIHI